MYTLYRVSHKKNFKDFLEKLDGIFQTWLWVLKLVVYPRHLQKKLEKNVEFMDKIVKKILLN